MKLTVCLLGGIVLPRILVGNQERNMSKPSRHRETKKWIRQEEKKRKKEERKAARNSRSGGEHAGSR